jgi:hypothetical protein
MSNGTLTIDMLYHPTLLIVYKSFHYICFFFTTIFVAFAIFVIFHKSSKAMSYYKYILINMLVWVYLLDLLYFLWQPVNNLPYFIISTTGVLQILPLEASIYIIIVFVFLIVGNVHSVGLALQFRIAALYPNTKFFTLMHTGRYFLTYAILVFIGSEAYLICKFLVFAFVIVGNIEWPKNHTL